MSENDIMLQIATNQHIITLAVLRRSRLKTFVSFAGAGFQERSLYFRVTGQILWSEAAGSGNAVAMATSPFPASDNLHLCLVGFLPASVA